MPANRFSIALPVIVIAAAVLLAGAMAYGTDPAWIGSPHGLSIIMISRRLRWLLAGLSLLCCIVLLGLVVAGKRRAWWLIGLAPVLALFLHAFATGAVNRPTVLDQPRFIPADQASFVGENDYVVGLTVGDQSYAYPYASLYWNPVVVQTDRDQRILLMWSAHANAAVATSITHQIQARQLHIVCEPANILLIYNARIGQFINGFTGATPGGAKPQGFLNPLPVWKGPWKIWRAMHPQTSVLASAQREGPRVPVLPNGPVAATRDVAPRTPILLLAMSHPAAILPGAIMSSPINIDVDGQPVLIFRDDTGVIKAFDRHLEPDLIAHFTLNSSSKRRGAFMDAGTDTGWNRKGVAVDGDKSRVGKRLAPIDLRAGVYWGVAKYWMPDLELLTPKAADVPVVSHATNAAPAPGPHAVRGARSHRRPKS